MGDCIDCYCDCTLAPKAEPKPPLPEPVVQALREMREALKECGRFGFWGKDTSVKTLIETTDHITETARSCLFRIDDVLRDAGVIE